MSPSHRVRRCAALLVACLLSLSVGCDPAGAADGAGPEKSAGLDGLHFKMIFAYGSFQQEHFLFSRDGKYYAGLPTGGPEHFDWARAEREQPATTGTYQIVNGELLLTPANGKAGTKYKYEVGADGVLLDGILLTKVDAFKPGGTLDGSYSWGALVGRGSGATVSAGVSYRFKPDGTFTCSRVAGVAVTAAGDSHSASTEGETSGTYTVSGNTMELKHKSGQVTRHCVYPYEIDPDDIRLNIDGNMCKRYEVK